MKSRKTNDALLTVVQDLTVRLWDLEMRVWELDHKAPLRAKGRNTHKRLSVAK